MREERHRFTEGNEENEEEVVLTSKPRHPFLDFCILIGLLRSTDNQITE